MLYLATTIYDMKGDTVGDTFMMYSDICTCLLVGDYKILSKMRR